MGHVWIVLEGEGTYGFYPDGIHVDEALVPQLRFERKITQDSSNRVVDVVWSYLSKRWDFVNEDCVTFARQVALAAGLNAPSAVLTRPAVWIGDLGTMN